MHYTRYTLWLIGQIIGGAWTITRDTIRIQNTQHPIIVHYPLRITSDWKRTLFSSSITMTPSTLSLGFRPAEEIPGAHSKSGMILLVHAVYGSSPEQVIADLADMEVHLCRECAQYPVVYEDWMYAGSCFEGYHRELGTPHPGHDERREKRTEQAKLEALAKRKRKQLRASVHSKEQHHPPSHNPEHKLGKNPASTGSQKKNKKSANKHRNRNRRQGEQS